MGRRFASCHKASYDGSEFTNATWRQTVLKEQKNITISSFSLPTVTSVIGLPSTSGQPRTPFSPKGGIGLQSTRDTTASVVDPAGATFTENGICAERHVFVGLLKHFESRPKYQHLNFAHVDRNSFNTPAGCALGNKTWGVRRYCMTC